MGSSRKPKPGRAKGARPGQPPRIGKIFPTASNLAQAEALEIPPGVLDEIESQRRVLVTVITLLHCLHIVLEHREDHLDEEPKPRIEAAVRWTYLPEMTAMLLERTHEVLSALDSNHLRNALKVPKP